MEAGVVDFSISERIYGVLRWFTEELQPLTGARYREGPEVRVVLGDLHETHPDAPGVFADLVIPAFRSTVTPRPAVWVLESDFLPKGMKEELVSLGPAIRFRFSALDDETYVIASRAEFLPERPKKAFWDLLQKVQARYPETGPSLQRYEAERKERVQENLRREFGDGDRVAGVAQESEPVTKVGDEKAETPSQPAAAAKANATKVVKGPQSEQRRKMHRLWEDRDADIAGDSAGAYQPDWRSPCDH